MSDSLSHDFYLSEKPNKITHLAFHLTAISQFQDSSPQIRDRIMYLITSGEAALLQGMTGQTHEERAWSWKRWI